MSIFSSPLLANLPVSSFAMVMGLSGLALVWGRVANMGWLPGWAPLLAKVFGLLACAVFVLLLLLYLKKMVSRGQDVLAEWHHPVKSAFFAAVAVSFALIGAVCLGLFAPLALPIWAVGALLQLIIMVMVLNAWIHREGLQPAHANPAWFIPAVANVVIPLGGVGLGYIEISWWFFAVGILFWVVMLTVVMGRLLFVQPPMPERLTPTLCILLAPPAVGFLSWMLLTGQHPDGRPIDVTGHILFGIALFFAIFLASQIRHFMRLPFFLSWWAFSFPVAAFTAATLVYSRFVDSPWMTALAAFMLGLSTLLIIWLLLRTVVAVVRHEPQLVD